MYKRAKMVSVTRFLEFPAAHISFVWLSYTSLNYCALFSKVLYKNIFDNLQKYYFVIIVFWQYDHMIRLVHEYHEDLMTDTHLHLAKVRYDVLLDLLHTNFVDATKSKCALQMKSMPVLFLTICAVYFWFQTSYRFFNRQQPFRN